MKLTESEKQAISKGETVRTTEGGINIVIMRADLYEQYRSVLPSEVVTELVDESLAEYDGNDPLLDSYQNPPS